MSGCLLLWVEADEDVVMQCFVRARITVRATGENFYYHTESCLAYAGVLVVVFDSGSSYDVGWV